MQHNYQHNNMLNKQTTIHPPQEKRPHTVTLKEHRTAQKISTTAQATCYNMTEFGHRLSLEKHCSLLRQKRTKQDITIYNTIAYQKKSLTGRPFLVHIIAKSFFFLKNTGLISCICWFMHRKPDVTIQRV